MRVLTLFILLTPLVSNAQYKLTGVVRDSVDQQPMPGVNVTIESQHRETVTNANGEFEIESRTESAQVTFSFIGFTTLTQTVRAKVSASIDLSYDKQLLEEYPDRFMKTNVEVGYFGDKEYAPYGGILNFSLQSLGKTPIGLTSSLKYWKEQKNAGLDVSIGMELRIPYFPQTILLGCKSITYTNDDFELQQFRGVFTYQLPRFFAIDFGSSFNNLMRVDRQEILVNEQHLNGTIGLTKIFSYSSFLKNWGFYSNFSYNPNWSYYEVGTYKELYIKKFTSFVVMAKYYDYGTLDGILLSIRFNLVDTRYYCCHSWTIYSGDINALK